MSGCPVGSASTVPSKTLTIGNSSVEWPSDVVGVITDVRLGFDYVLSVKRKIKEA